MGNVVSLENYIKQVSQVIDEKLKLADALGDAKLQSIQIIVNDAVKLVSKEMGDKIQDVNEAVKLVSKEMGDKMQDVNEAVKLVSEEMGDKIQTANSIAIDAMLLGTSELDKRIFLVDRVLDRQRGKLLSSAIAFVYFTLLMAYTLYSRSNPETGTGEENLFVVLQFAILGVWMADLVSSIGSGTNRDGFYILALMMMFAGFIFYRGRNNKRGKPEDSQLRKEVVSQ